MLCEGFKIILDSEKFDFVQADIFYIEFFFNFWGQILHFCPNLTMLFHRICIYPLFIFFPDTGCQCSSRVRKFAHIARHVYFVRSEKTQRNSLSKLATSWKQGFTLTPFFRQTWKNAVKVINFTGRDHTNEAPRSRSFSVEGTTCAHCNTHE